jgi:hypothetical protein
MKEKIYILFWIFDIMLVRHSTIFFGVMDTLKISDSFHDLWRINDSPFTHFRVRYNLWRITGDFNFFKLSRLLCSS